MKAKHLCFILLAFTLNAFSQNDSTSGKWNCIIRSDYGFIIAHRPQLEPLQEAHVKGFEITLSRTTDGSEYWQRDFIYPDYGVTIAAFDLGTDKLGHGIAAYPFIDFPLGKKTFNKIHFRYGLGLGYIEKIFNAEDNIKNAAIGSHLNGVIHFDLHYSGKLSKRTSIETGPAITHFSNGSFSLPNLGINIATFNLALQHSFGNKSAIKTPEKPPVNKSSQIHAYVGGFPKRVYPPDGEDYFAFTLSGLYYKPFSFRSAWGIGADFFYDNSIYPRIKTFGEKEPEKINNLRAGMYGSYNLTVGRIGLLFNMGYYLYNAWDGDGNVYHRIGLRYYFEKLFICMNLKTHYARADFVELGAGIRFIKKVK